LLQSNVGEGFETRAVDARLGLGEPLVAHGCRKRLGVNLGVVDGNPVGVQEVGAADETDRVDDGSTPNIYLFFSDWGRGGKCFRSFRRKGTSMKKNGVRTYIKKALVTPLLRMAAASALASTLASSMAIR
jgi:hypothetical protein